MPKKSTTSSAAGPGLTRMDCSSPMRAPGCMFLDGSSKNWVRVIMPTVLRPSASKGMPSPARLACEASLSYHKDEAAQPTNKRLNGILSPGGYSTNAHNGCLGLLRRVEGTAKSSGRLRLTPGQNAKSEASTLSHEGKRTCPGCESLSPVDFDRMSKKSLVLEGDMLSCWVWAAGDSARPPPLSET